MLNCIIDENDWVKIAMDYDVTLFNKLLRVVLMQITILTIMFWVRKI